MHNDDHGKQIRKTHIPAEITETFGPWMMVSRSARKIGNNSYGKSFKAGKQEIRKDNGSIPTENKHKSHSNFDLLGEEDNFELGPNEIGLEQVDANSTRASKLEGRGRRLNVQVNIKENQWKTNE